MTTETDSDYETSGHESTASNYQPEPRRFAEVHMTVGGAMQFVGDQGRWITSDTVVEVTR
ncbi:hypothetical protein BRD17_04005 [Halobacteriales archaeon SW_7_68_16]|nr:MAG: hypothetical protein BRD17_04005 [Halobacteriales archaeon SW_7_68_16]